MADQDAPAVRKLARALSPSGEVQQADTRIQRSTLTLTVSLCLLLAGSGGIVAEIFHTSQVFQKGAADYVAEANKVTGEGLGQFWKDVSLAMTEADGKVAAARNKSHQIEVSAQAEVRQIDMEALSEAAGSQQLAHTTRGLVPAVEQVRYFNVLRDSLAALSTVTKLKVQLVAIESLEPGEVAEVVLPVPWSPTLDSSIYGFNCIIVGDDLDRCKPSLSKAVGTKEFQVAEVLRKRDILPPLAEAQKLQLELYRRNLEDLEEVLVYNALDLRRYKSGNQSVPMDVVNREWSRVLEGLRNVRHRFQQLDEIETVYKRSKRGESLPVFEMIFADIFADDVKENHDEDPTKAIGAWVRDRVPQFTTEAARDRRNELALRRSDFYQSLRPFLANIWATWNLGRISPLVMFGLQTPNTALRNEPSGIFGHTDERTIDSGGIPPSVMISFVLLLAAGIVVCVWYSFRTFPKRGRLALLSLAPVVVLALAFPIHQSFASNQSTEKIASNLVSQVLPTHSAQDYVQRAGAAVNRISVAGTEASSRIEQDAEAEKNRLVSQARGRAGRYKQAATMESARAFMLMNKFTDIAGFCRDIPDDVVRGTCSVKLSDARFRLDRETNFFNRSSVNGLPAKVVDSYKY